MDRAEIYFSIADEVASAMVSLKFIAIIRGKSVRDIFMISGVFWILSLEMLPTFTFRHDRYIVLTDKECFNFSFLIALDYLPDMDIPRSSTASNFNTALTSLRPSQSCPNFKAFQPTAALAQALHNFNTSSPLESNYNLRRVLAGTALVQTNTNSSETPNQILSFIARQAALNEELNNNNHNLINIEEFSGATAFRNASNGDLNVEYGEASFEERFGLFRRESLESLLPFMTSLPISYNLVNGNLGTSDDNSNSSSVSTSVLTNDTGSSDSFADDSSDSLEIIGVTEAENPILEFRNMARIEFGSVRGAYRGNFRPRNIYDRDLANYGRGRGYLSRSTEFTSNNDTPSNDSFVGRGRGVLGRGRGFYDTNTSSFGSSTEYTDSRAGRGVRRGLDAMRFGGGTRRTWSSGAEPNGCWAGISGA